MTQKFGLPTTGEPQGTVAFLDYDRDSFSMFVAFTRRLKSAKRARQANPFCSWRGLRVFCGPRGFRAVTICCITTIVAVPLPMDTQGGNRLRPHYSLGVVSSDFDDDGWPDIYVT